MEKTWNSFIKKCCQISDDNIKINYSFISNGFRFNYFSYYGFHSVAIHFNQNTKEYRIYNFSSKPTKETLEYICMSESFQLIKD